MAPTLLPFLYQTRTLQRVCRRPVGLVFARKAHTIRSPKSKPDNQDNSIPFEWNNDESVTELSEVPGEESTITPSEAEIFKGIFDDIAKGKLPKARKRSPVSDSDSKRAFDGLKQASAASQHNQQQMTGSIVDQVRVTEFREQFLQRYPRSLRKAAETALGKFELEPQRHRVREEMPELDEAEAEKMAEWSRYQKVRDEEKERVEALMGKCQTDIELWTIMEREVFSLPRKLGIVPATPDMPKKGRKSKKNATSVAEESIAAEASSFPDVDGTPINDEKRIMDVHGPLYSHYLTMGLSLLDSAFTRPSPLAFQILPRIKELGLSSYVLGVSTPFYSKLAQMYWNRFGDATSCLDMVQEMNSLGLPADDQVTDLLVQIREDLHGCTWGAQGPFVMAMMESAPYDAALSKRLNGLAKIAMDSAMQNFPGPAA